MTRTTRPHTSARLREALSLLETDDKITVSKLCSLAHISRNTLYKYHPEILIEVQQLKARAKANEAAKPTDPCRLSAKNKELGLQISQLVSLVDHYFAAWQETSALLRRRDRELAEVRRELGVQLKTITRRSPS